MLITPGKRDLEEHMQVCEGHRSLDKRAAPDEWTDTPEDDAELVDAVRCGRGCHDLRVAQHSMPLQGFPWYLALAYFIRARRRADVFTHRPDI
jgi:hypothetical protein